MPTSIFYKVNGFSANLAKKLVNLDGTPVVALTNTAHTSTWDKLSDLTQVSYTNCSSRSITITSVSQTDGTMKAIYADLTLTASGGSVGPFRYAYIYDDSSASDYLIGYFDYGSALTIGDTETLLLNFDNTNGILTLF